MNTNTILFGGKTVSAFFEPIADPAAEGGFRVPAPEAVKVRQIPVREYEAGFAFIDDEPALVGFLCGKNKPWALTLSPESFEEILAAGREVNEKGFFSSCRRRTERVRAEQQALFTAMAAMPADKLKLAMDAGLAAQGKYPSPNSSPGLLPPPAR